MAQPTTQPRSAARKRDREATTQALLCAAKKVFAQRGYDAATTREVAVEAGANEGLIQRYFGGKAGLLLAILTESESADQKCSLRLPPIKDQVDEEIESLLGFLVRYTWESQELQRVVMYRSLVDPKVAAHCGRHFADHRARLILGRLEALRDRGQVAPAVELKAVAHALSTLSYGLGFTDQVAFGTCSEAVRSTVAGLARALTLGLAPR